MDKYFYNSKGISLIEIIVSIALLSIVLITLFGVFIQSNKHTKYNEEKLDSIQIAEIVKAEVLNGERTSDVEIKDYPGYKVNIKIVDGPSSLPKLKKAMIVVSSNDNGIKRKPFTTEMYFEVK